MEDVARKKEVVKCSDEKEDTKYLANSITNLLVGYVSPMLSVAQIKVNLN